MISPVKLTPNMDPGTLANALNNNFNQIESENRTKVIKDENGVNSIVIGKVRGTGDNTQSEYVVKISKPGFDVLTCSDADLIFNSNQNIFKIKEVLTGTLTAKNLPVNASGYSAGTGLAKQITHGLGYTPQVTGYIDIGGTGSYIQLPATMYGVVPSGPLVGSPYWITTYIATTPTYINVLANIMVLNVTGATGQSVGTSADSYKLYINQETANA